ncbi:hypothetical protein C5F49_06680 [Nitrosopumilus oxyclinae]|uniref:Uncharacterized protein n=1 Tax=Nitrosopumilus oxyclinae TaxID=1959104 RepID=A0A7D5M387_9ARCH|nr:hypothetical protein [Nitrosopumilus oxyclinae]QLH05035.1 hypothetical protein C5F49_06680 [Nitrosopumilus oxyclinae]
MGIMQKVLIILIMVGFTISIQTAYGSAVMPGETDTIFCDLCIEQKDLIKKSKNKEFNMVGFDFEYKDTRKYPTWVNWMPAEPLIDETPSALEQRMENDKNTSHGISRNHILFSALVYLEEVKAKQKINLNEINNDDFYKLDNFHTIYPVGSDIQDIK